MRSITRISGAILPITLILIALFVTAASAQEIEFSVKTQKDYYRAGDQFRVNLKAWNPAVARTADLYLCVTGPDLKSYYMPDWGELKHPWLHDLTIPAGFSFGPATVFQTTLPDYNFPVWQPGQYQISAELVDAVTREPLAPFVMASFGVKRGLVELLYDKSNWVLDVAANDEEFWTASPGGVVKWSKEDDTWQYERYTRFDGLADTYMIEMYRDQFGNLIMWPYIGYGITVYDGQSFTNLLGDQQLYVAGIVTDRDMNMWIVGGLGVLMVSRNGELRWCGEEDGLPAGCSGVRIALTPDGYPVAVVKDSANELLLCGYDGDRWWTIPFPFDWTDENGAEMTPYIRCMAVDMRGHAWFGTLYGALEFDGSTTTLYSHENSGLAGNNVYKIKTDSIGRLWFVCCSFSPGQGGLCSYDGQTWGTMPGLDYPDVTGLAITFDGMLGIGRTEGLSILEAGSPLSVHRTEGPDMGSPSSNIAWGPDGTMFVPDSAKGLWAYRDGLWNLMTSENGLATDSAVAIEFDSQGVAWIASAAGVTRWEGLSFTTFTVADGLPANSVFGLTIDAQDRPWVITSGEAWEISYYDGTFWHVLSTEEGAPEAPYMIDADTRGLVWVIDMRVQPDSSYFFGLLNYDGDSWHDWTNDPDYVLVSRSIPLLYCDSRGRVITSGWTALTNRYSVGVFDGSSWTYEPFDDYVISAAEDGVGRLWLNLGYGYSTAGVWVPGQSLDVLTAENADIACNALTGVSRGPQGDIYITSAAGLERHYLNPNVAAIANAESVIPGDTLTLKYWAENPGGADRELDLYVLITLPTGDSLYLPTLAYEPVPYGTITIPKETTLNPTEMLTLSIPEGLPAGDYTITPWFCGHGSTEQTGQCTPVMLTITN
ncbi:MAG TPA: hypothetical protein VM163_13065 [bacterium]|nr:hypothetical protein [bacterium]